MSVKLLLLKSGEEVITEVQEMLNPETKEPMGYHLHKPFVLQVDAEIVLQNPVRIYGLLAFFAAVALAQIMLVLKKKQIEKVQAAEGNF